MTLSKDTWAHKFIYLLMQLWLKKTIQPPALASASSGTVVNARSTVEDLRPSGEIRLLYLGVSV